RQSCRWRAPGADRSAEPPGSRHLSRPLLRRRQRSGRIAFARPGGREDLPWLPVMAARIVARQGQQAAIARVDPRFLVRRLAFGVWRSAFGWLPAELSERRKAIAERRDGLAMLH